MERANTPSFYVGAGGGYGETMSATSEGAAYKTDVRGTTSAGVRASTDLGTAIDLGVGGSVRHREVNRDPSTRQNVVLGPYYGLDATLEGRQPLLRGTDARPAALEGARSSPVVAPMTPPRAPSCAPPSAQGWLTSVTEPWTPIRLVGLTAQLVHMGSCLDRACADS